MNHKTLGQQKQFEKSFFQSQGGGKTKVNQQNKMNIFKQKNEMEKRKTRVYVCIICKSDDRNTTKNYEYIKSYLRSESLD